jgi:dihydroorotate dehydrogenase (NAD+) catalytic subunit
LEFFEAGADAIAIGTANFINPLAMPELIKALEDHMAKQGFATIADLKQNKKQGTAMSAGQKGA